MKDITKKFLIFIISLGLIVSCSGCSQMDTPTNADESETVTYWVEFGNRGLLGVDNFGQLPQFKKLQEKFGVNIEYKHPSSGHIKEQLNLMLASDKMTDIIEYGFYGYPGGPQKAIDDGYIISLNDVFDKYCPNLKKYLSEHPEIDKMIKTDEGNYYCFPGIYDDEYLLVYSGLIIRQDFLDKIGMERPETVAQWEAVLSAFKNELAVETPLSLGTWSVFSFIQAYGVYPGLYVDEGVVKYGAAESGFKDAMITLNRWYELGLIDKNIASLTGDIINQNVVNGDTGALYGNTGSGLGLLMNELDDVEGAELVSVRYPVLEKGDTPFYGQRVEPYSIFGSASISTQCKNIELAAKILDFGYSDEGRMLFNFGIEGESYNMIDGYPTYTEKVTDNPNGKSMNEMLYYYTSPNGIGPFLRDRRYMEQFANLPQQKESIELWSDTGAREHMLPPVNLNSVEANEIAIISGDIEKYANQMMFKFITGVEPIENYELFTNHLNSLGMQKYLEIYQNAYNRYINK